MKMVCTMCCGSGIYTFKNISGKHSLKCPHCNGSGIYNRDLVSTLEESTGLFRYRMKNLITIKAMAKACKVEAIDISYFENRHMMAKGKLEKIRKALKLSGIK